MQRLACALALTGAMILGGCNGGIEDGAYGGPVLGLLDGSQGSVVSEAAGAAAAALGAQAGSADGVVVVCDLKRRELGRKIDSRPERGQAQYTLYDSNPGATGLRNFHVTGFADGCARRVTAALAMFGSVELYEMVRYSGLVEVGGKATDATYDQLRRASCGARNAPCKGRGLNAMVRETAFLQAYPRKGSAAHLEILMHKGAVAATARK